jgi:hypothetical protein
MEINNLPLQDTQQSPSQINARRFTPSHVAVEMLKCKDKKQVIKQQEKATDHT